MDKTSIMYAKKNDKEIIHEMPTGMPRLHKNYGLWIFSYRRNAKNGQRLKIAPRYFEFYGLSHSFKGRGWYCSLNGKVESVEKGECVISTPGFVQDYCGSEDDYSEDSICFSGAIADQLFNSGIIKNGVFPLGSERRLLAIFDLVDNPSHDSQIRANFELQKLLIDIYFNRKYAKKHEKYPQIDFLIEQIISNPKKWWTSREMSELCNLSESQFRIVFEKKTGMKPKSYIDRLKIQKASELLCNSNLSIAVISEDLGYMDPFHFSRRFKQITGLAPDHYRKQYRLR